MPGRLFGKSCIALGHRASAANKTAAGKAQLTFRLIKVSVTGRHIIPVLCQSACWAGRQAGRRTGVARAGQCGRQIDFVFQGKCPAKADHQALRAMDQKPNWAGPATSTAFGPTVERVIRRAAEGEECLSPQIAGHAANNAPRPAVDRIRMLVLPFWLCGQMGPEPRLTRAKQEQGFCPFWEIFCICRGSMKPAQNLKGVHIRRGRDFRKCHRRTRGFTRGSVDLICDPAP